MTIFISCLEKVLNCSGYPFQNAAYQLETAFTQRNPACFGSDFLRGSKLPEIWKAPRCDCFAFKGRSSLERRRQSEWLLALTHTFPLALPSEALALSTFGLRRCVPALASLCEREQWQSGNSAPLSPPPRLHVDSDNVTCAWLQIAGSRGNDWAGATGPSLVDRINYPHHDWINTRRGCGWRIFPALLLLFLCLPFSS